MVPDLIWAPDIFGSQEIWSPRNLGPKKFGYGNFYEGTKIFRDQFYWGPKKSWAQMG